MLVLNFTGVNCQCNIWLSKELQFKRSFYKWYKPINMCHIIWRLNLRLNFWYYEKTYSTNSKTIDFHDNPCKTCKKQKLKVCCRRCFIFAFLALWHQTFKFEKSKHKYENRNSSYALVVGDGQLIHIAWKLETEQYLSLKVLS